MSIWVVRGLNGSVITAAPDLFSIGLAAAVLVASAAGAVLPIALRAARTDPLIALRSD